MRQLHLGGLVLPNFTSHDHGGVPVPFARLWHVRSMQAALAAVNITALAPTDYERGQQPGACGRVAHTVHSQHRVL